MKISAEKFGRNKIMPYICTRNQVSLISRGTMARLASSRLTTSIKVQISRERQRDRTLQTSTENATELVATLKSNKTKKSQTLITQDAKTLVVLD